MQTPDVAHNGTFETGSADGPGVGMLAEADVLDRTPVSVTTTVQAIPVSAQQFMANGVDQDASGDTFC